MPPKPPIGYFMRVPSFLKVGVDNIYKYIYIEKVAPSLLLFEKSFILGIVLNAFIV